MKKLLKTKRMKIVVGTNALTEIQYPAYTNHCQFWFRLGRSYPDIDFIISNPSRMSIDRMRNMTAKVALETKADYILFLDDDVIVNPNYGLEQLLECKSDVAAGKVNIRGYPFEYMSFSNNKDGGLIADKELPRTGIVDRDAVGFSFALIKVDLIRRIQEPYFITGINHTEDIYFCVKARQIVPKCTIKVNCGCECGHILWPEIMTEQSRDAYIKYFMEVHRLGGVRLDHEFNVKKLNGNTKDRGIDYLASIKEVEHERAKA